MQCAQKICSAIDRNMKNMYISNIFGSELVRRVWLLITIVKIKFEIEIYVSYHENVDYNRCWSLIDFNGIRRSIKKCLDTWLWDTPTIYILYDQE